MGATKTGLNKPVFVSQSLICGFPSQPAGGWRGRDHEAAGTAGRHGLCQNRNARNDKNARGLCSASVRAAPFRLRGSLGQERHAGGAGVSRRDSPLGNKRRLKRKGVNKALSIVERDMRGSIRGNTAE